MLHLIVNPTAGNGRAEKTLPRLEEVLRARGVPYDVRRTERPGHAAELAASIAAPGDTVAAVGGDGTLLETAEGLVGTGAALGILPAGTGNDVAKTLRIPRDPVAAADFMLSHPPRPVDVASYNGKVFLNAAGVGFDVQVLECSLKAKRYVRGILPYLYGVVRTIFTFRPTRVALTLDGEELPEKDVLIVSVANGRFVGGGIEIAPEAKPDDGLLDVTVIDSMPRRRMFPQLIRILRGRVLQVPGASMRRCRSVVARVKGGLRLDVDGEVLPVPEARIEILPGALPVHWAG